MDRLKNWKTADVIGQVLFGILPLLLGLTSMLRAGFVTSLFALGGWQLLSFLVHLVLKGAAWKSKARLVYATLLVGLLLFGLIAITSEDILMPFLYSALVAGPVLGIFYFIVSLTELNRIYRREPVLVD